MATLETKLVNIGLVTRPVPPVREHFDEQEMARLVSSIRENGILVPLLVRPRGDQFEVIDGDRRLHAAFEAGVREIPVVVRDLDDHETHIQRMLANLDRHDTDPVSEAKYCARLIAEGTFDIEGLAAKLGRSVVWVENRIVIAEMPQYMQEALSRQQMSLGVCLELNEIHDDATKDRYFAEALRNGMTVRAAEYNKLMVNEAIDALHASGEPVHEEAIPEPEATPRIQCALTDEILFVTEMRLVRVGIRNLEEARLALRYKGEQVRTTP